MSTTKNYDPNSLTRNERQGMNDLSKLTFGISSKWKTMMTEGRLEEVNSVTSNGSHMVVKIRTPLAVEDVRLEMENILKAKTEQLNKQAKEESNEKTGNVSVSDAATE